MQEVDLKLVQGNYRSYPLLFTNLADEPIDITGSTVYFTCKQNVEDTDEDAIFQKIVDTHVQPTEGRTKIILSHSDTDKPLGDYWYDIQLSTVGKKPLTIQRGRLQIVYRITDAV